MAELYYRLEFGVLTLCCVVGGYINVKNGKFLWCNLSQPTLLEIFLVFRAISSQDFKV